MTQIILSVALICYIAQVLPFELRRDNYIEIMNECFILLTLDMSLGIIVDDRIISGEMKQQFGFAMIALVLLNIALNFFIFIVSLVQSTFTTLKLTYLKWKKNIKV
jgi:hypothetical protein